MERKILFVLLLGVFIIGWISNSTISHISNANKEMPLSASGEERLSPKDRVSEDDIRILKDRVILNLSDSFWARFADTNSMDPIIDKGANSIELKPKNESDLQIGDIISYDSSVFNSIIVHRVIDINYDENGWFAVTKGDNNEAADPEKIRFGQIKGVLAAIIY